MDFEFLQLSGSSTSDSDDILYQISKGDYLKFDSIDEDILAIADIVQDDRSDNSGQYHKYDNDSLDLDDLVLINSDEEFIKYSPNDPRKWRSEEIDINQNIYAAKYDEVVQEIKDLQVQSKTERLFNPFVVLHKRFNSMSNDMPKLAKRPSFMNKLKSEKYTGLFRRKSKLSRTYSLPKIVVDSPPYSGPAEKYSNISEQYEMNNFEESSSNLKLCISSKKKAMRRSI